jgi:putative transposase
MSDKYKIFDYEKAYFVTLTVVDWIDVFTKRNYKTIVVDSLKYCQEYKGLEVYAWVLMSNHLHLIAKATGRYSLSEILRDFKKFTAKAIIHLINEDIESRKAWMLNRFEFNAKYHKRVEVYKFWQDGNHAEIISSPERFYEKLNYIHNNPVKQMIVSAAEDYLHSSARNYAGSSTLIDIILETPQLRTVG